MLQGEQKTNIGLYSVYGRSRCRVSFTDPEGIHHGVDVDAETLYEAVAIAVANFREDNLSPSSPGPMTEFTVVVYRNPPEHKIRLQQVLKWSEHSTNYADHRASAAGFSLDGSIPAQERRTR